MHRNGKINFRLLESTFILVCLTSFLGPQNARRMKVEYNLGESSRDEGEEMRPFPRTSLESC